MGRGNKTSPNRNMRPATSLERPQTNSGRNHLGRTENLGKNPESVTDPGKRQAPNRSPIWVPDPEKQNRGELKSKISPRQTPNGEEERTRFKVIGKIKRPKASQSTFEDYHSEKEDLHIIKEDGSEEEQTSDEETQNKMEFTKCTIDSI